MASKQMSYCSLEEAWGTEYANLYKKDDNMLTAMPKKSVNPDDNILKDRSLTKVSTPLDKDMGNYYMNKKDELQEPTGSHNQRQENFESGGALCSMLSCDKFLEHFLDCTDCKKRVNQILDINPNKSLVENFRNLDDNYLDIFILVLTGIFVIFILDCFVRLGKNFRK